LILFLIALVFLAGRPLLENFGSGLVLQARHAFTTGDQVSSNDHTGTVMEVNTRATVIKTVDGKVVYLPNRDVLNNPLVNYTAEGLRRSTLKIGVEYGTDLRLAVGVIDRALGGVATVHDDPPHQVFVNEFNDSSIDLLAWYWHQPEIDDEFVATDDVALAIKDALDDAGIVIAFPQRVLWRGKPGEGGGTYGIGDAEGDAPAG
jgi:small-conductance mechanosensitive channel